MRRLAFLLLLLLPVLAFAENEFFYYSSADFLTSVNGLIDFEITGSNPAVQDFSFQSFFAPQSNNLEIISLSHGEIVLGEENVFYINTSSLSSSINYSAELSFQSSAPVFWLDSLELLNKVDYPAGFEKFLAFDEFVNPTPEMEALASSLVEGVKYKAEAVLRIVSFVHNYIDYNLDIGGSDLLSAEWVFNNKVGTCDEYSVLTAALLRSIGIPVRFVHGFVKADVLGGYGPHSYLEVYLSGKWVPFDPTWGQYGFVDVTHVKLMTSDSPVFIMSSVSYKHRDASVSAANPSISFLMDSYENQGELFNISGSFDRSEYYEDDYAVLTLSIRSPDPRPVILPLWLTTTNSLKPVKTVDYVLVTDGFRVVRIVFKTPKTSFPGVIHPVLVSAPYSNALNLNLTNLKGSALSSLDMVSVFLENDDLVENPHVSVGIDTDLKFYGYQAFLNVSLLNDGNTVLDDLVISLPNHAANTSVNSLGINKRVNVPFLLNYSFQRAHDEMIRVYQDGVLLSSYSFSNENVEEPVFSLNAFYNVSGTEYNLTVVSDANFVPSASVLNISSGDFQLSTSLSGNRSFLIPIDLAGLGIDLEWVLVDSFGKEYSLTESVEIEIGLIDKIIYYIKRFFSLLLYS